MTVKLTIEKNTPAARVFKEYMAEKEAFRKAAEEGKLQEYVVTKPQRFAAPLPLSLQNSGAYTFTTDHGIFYACGFTYLTPILSPMLGVYDLEVYDFEFHANDPEPEIRKPKDERISSTITGVLESFFTNSNRILLYLCDAADGRARQRQALFKRWHESINSMIYRRDLEVDTGHGIAYGSIMTRKDFQHMDVVQYELVDKATGILLEKFDR